MIVVYALVKVMLIVVIRSPPLDVPNGQPGIQTALL